MLRIFAIMYHSHYECIKKAGGTTQLNLCFKRFLVFIFEFSILDKEHREFVAFKGLPVNAKKALGEQNIKFGDDAN